jgi:hypothetical protein
MRSWIIPAELAQVKPKVTFHQHTLPVLENVSEIADPITIGTKRRTELGVVCPGAV